MHLKPFHHAILAELYIVTVALLISNAERFSGPEDNIMMPIAFLSLLVLSVSAMAFLFFYRPLALLIGGDVKAATRFFVGTWASFALITALAFIGIYIVGRLS